MRFIPLLLFIVYVFVTSVLATDNKKQNKVDYDNFVKYWETENYLEKAKNRYSEYIKNTKFDNEFKLEQKDRTAGYGNALSGNILIIINQFLYNPQTLDEINTFKNDLESEGYSVNIVTSTNTNEPDTLRDYLYQQWTINNIEGAFLIGGLAIAWYEMPITNENGDTTDWDVFPCDLYYMDLDGEWLDNENSNGIHDDHTGNVDPDIWIGRFYTPTMTFHDVSESQHVERYLDKVHEYREGTLRLKDQALSYVQEDWAGYHMENEVLKLYDEVTYINDGINGYVRKSDYKERIKAGTNNKYEWLYLAAHSSPWDHCFIDGWFNSEEIEPLDVQVLFYLNFNCSAASYREDDCLCNWYVMQEPYGLLSVGSTKGGSMLHQYDYYEPLNEGYTFGEAFKYWGIRHYNIRDWHYGMSVIGDPTLKVSRFMANPSQKFCYAIAPEKEALMGDTVPLFKWTTNDSADNYQVEITKSTTVIWTSDETTDTLVQMPTGILEHGCSYKWTVKAYSGLECIDFTQKRKFTITDSISNYLSDLVPEYHSQDWGTLQFDKSCDGNAIKINGKEYEKGLGTHANSIIRYSLNGEYKLFTAVIGHDDESNGGNGITFEVKLDDNTIYGPSKVFMWGTEAENIELNVTNGYKLELLVHGRGDIDYDHADWADAIIWVDSTQTSIKDNNSLPLLPEKITLISNYPNPFNCSTTIIFQTSPKLTVSLSIFNVLGQKVKTLIDNKKLSGIQKVKWDGTDNSGSVVSSGLYFCRISDGNEHQSGKILLMK